MVRGLQGAVLPRVDPAGRHAVHAHVGRHGHGERVSEGHDAALGRRIGERVGLRHVRAGRGDGDDGAAGCLEVGGQRAGQQEGRGQVDGEHAVPRVQARRRHGLELRDAGVGDERVDAPEAAAGDRNHPLDVALDPHVAADADATDLGRDLLGGVRIHVGAGDGPAHMGEVTGDPCADAVRGARHDDGARLSRHGRVSRRRPDSSHPCRRSGTRRRTKDCRPIP